MRVEGKLLGVSVMGKGWSRPYYMFQVLCTEGKRIVLHNVYDMSVRGDSVNAQIGDLVNWECDWRRIEGKNRLAFILDCRA